MLVYIEMCVGIGPMFPIKFKMLTIQVKTREGNKKKKKRKILSFCQDVCCFCSLQKGREK